MDTLSALFIVVQRTLVEWWRVRWSDLHFAEADAALLLMLGLLAISAMALLTRRLWRRTAGRTHVSLPALLPMIRQSSLSASRHAAFFICLLGVPFFAVALAAPQTAFTREEVSYPGRRIAIAVDSSSSMVLTFKSAKLNALGAPAFYTAVAAADYFMRLRMAGPYHDLIALLQFGNYAYVVTPFTTDYENILISVKLVGDPKEWGRFTDSGTTIIQSISQGLALFKAFNFLNASGNLLLIFTDGRDDQTVLRDQRLQDLMAEAAKTKVPIFMIRTAYNSKLGDLPQDKLWKAAVEASGGRFYPAGNEEDILNAIREIDRLSPGRIELREYTSQRPRFSGYALIAVALWMLAATLKLGVPYFRTFP